MPDVACHDANSCQLLAYQLRKRWGLRCRSAAPLNIDSELPHAAAERSVLMTSSLHRPSPLLLLISCRLLPMLLLLSLPVASSSTVTLPLLISEHLILPRAPLRAELWGRAAANAAVNVTLDSHTTFTTAADSGGAWSLTLPPQPASHGPHSLHFTDGGAAVTVSGLRFGDVLLCAGQSNMQQPVSLVFNGSETLAATAHYPSLHLFSVAEALSHTPQEDVSSTFEPAGTGWLPASPKSASCGSGCWKHFSAVCLMTGMRLYDSLHGSVPIGLVAATWESTAIAAWSSAAAFAQCGPLSPPDRSPQNAASVLWNAMIHPLRRLRFTAALWYQGESDTFMIASRYACAFTAMIADWRLQFRSPALPFYFVLLAAYGARGSWAELRQSQLAALALPAVDVASAIDLGDRNSPVDSIHPRLKGPIADRLARLIRTQLYGEAGLVAHGPQLDGAAATASLSANNSLVTVLLALNSSMPSNSGLTIRPTPGCAPCCSETVAGLLTVQVADSQTVYTPVVSVDARSATLSFSFSLSSSAPLPLAAAGSRISVLVEQTSWPGCVLYNAHGLPALPAIIHLTLAAGLPNGSSSGDSGEGAARRSSGVVATVIITAAAFIAVALCVAVCAQSLSVSWREVLPSDGGSDTQLVKRLNFDSEEAQLIGTDSEDDSSVLQAAH